MDIFAQQPLAGLLSAPIPSRLGHAKPWRRVDMACHRALAQRLEYTLNSLPKRQTQPKKPARIEMSGRMIHSGG
jgi:hypothetical protein